jgi:selenocysteine lyase/cysteine desulfurase
VRLAREIGCELKVWRVTGDLAGGANLELSKLEEVVGPKTRIVAFTACSNILGQYTPVREVVDLVARRSEGRAKTVLDCVAYAPHAQLDVQAWGVDFLGFSFYKVFAPHVSLLYVAPTANDMLASLGHYFHPSAPSYKLAPGGASYELIYSTAAVLPYVASLSGLPDSTSVQERLSVGWTAVQAHEQLLGEKLLDYLTSDASRAKGVRVVGPQGMGPEKGRSAVTISFVVLDKGSFEPTGKGQIRKRIQSKDIVERFDKSGKVRPQLISFQSTPC